jgi:hypothetical protein
MLCSIRKQLTLHLSFGVDNDPSIVLKIYEDPILPTPGLPLAHHHCRQDCKQSVQALKNADQQKVAHCMSHHGAPLQLIINNTATRVQGD